VLLNQPGISRYIKKLLSQIHPGGSSNKYARLTIHASRVVGWFPQPQPQSDVGQSALQSSVLSYTYNFQDINFRVLTLVNLFALMHFYHHAQATAYAQSQWCPKQEGCKAMQRRLITYFWDAPIDLQLNHGRSPRMSWRHAWSLVTFSKACLSIKKTCLTLNGHLQGGANVQTLKPK